jgi:hypothetical protein
MNSARRIAGIALVVLDVGALSVFAQSQEIPLTNWTVPPYTSVSVRPEAGLTTMADITPGVAFVGVAPCRIVDTRGGGVFTGNYGPPALVANTPRNFDLNSAPHCTGLPEALSAYSLNFTVVNTGAAGDLRAWPQDNPPVQVTSVLNWTAANTIIANAIIVPAGTGGGITVTAAGTGANLLIDVNGYFTGVYNAGVQFVASGSFTGGMISGTNASNATGAAGVKGVQGAAIASASSEIPAGVVGTSFIFDGVLGITQCSAGVGNCSGGAGVRGIRTSGASLLSSGELGVANLGGRFFNDVEINGDLDVGTGDTTFGPGNLAVLGALTVSGTKMFVEPHPTDASKLIKYVSLEGNESGTYFRGRARFQNGVARIHVPEDFRMVTSADGLTVQITPIGGMATFAVMRLSLDEIVVQGSRNVEFSYLVQGVRRAFRDFQPIEDAGPRFARGANARLPRGLAPELQQRLIANGTYNEDGTVNMDTARRLGWDRIWADREHEDVAAPQPNP